MKWDALCVTFFIFAALAALAALIYWLINLRVKEKPDSGQKLKKQDKKSKS